MFILISFGEIVYAIFGLFVVEFFRVGADLYLALSESNKQTYVGCFLP